LLSSVTACGSSGGASDAGPDVDADTTTPLCQPVSGSRLRVRWIDGGSVAAFDGFQDLELGTRCSVTTLNDSARCAPSPVATGTIAFTDAGCTSRMFLPAAEIGDATYFRQSVVAADGCGNDLLYAKIGTTYLHPAGGTLYSLNGAGACVGAAKPAATYYRIDPDLSLDAMVGFTAETTVEGKRLDFAVLEADDGTKTCQGSLTDVATGEECSVTTAEDGVARCLPLTAPVTVGSSDLMCTQPLQYATNEASCGAPAAAVGGLVDSSFCVARTRLFDLDEPITAAYDATCVAVTADTDTSLYALGAAISPFSYPASLRERVDVGERLERLDNLIEGGPRLPTARAWDGELGLTCVFQAMADGSLRCRPIGESEQVASAAARFSDAACATPIEVGLMPATCGDETPRFAVRGDVGGVRVWPVGEPHLGALYQGAPGSCTAFVPTGNVFDLGTELGPEQLVEGTRRTE
jgi:hypothetical protein